MLPQALRAALWALPVASPAPPAAPAPSLLAPGHNSLIHQPNHQRTTQQVVEIAPAPGLDDGLRQALFDDAVKLARHVGYR